MIRFVLFALASAFFPALLAGVAVILTRERPARLLLAFWIGGLIVSVGAGLTILSVYGEHAAALDHEGKSVAPGILIFGGILAITVGLLLGTRRGVVLLDSWRERRKLRHQRHGKPEVVRQPFAERLLGRGSTAVAFVAGGVLNLPGPFYLLALGDIGAAHHRPVTQLLLVLLFNVVMLLLVELPIIGYALDPERTDVWVGKLSATLDRVGLRVVASIAGLWGLSLLAQGIHRVVS